MFLLWQKPTLMDKIGFWFLVSLLPLGLWKLLEILIWLTNHIDINFTWN